MKKPEDVMLISFGYSTIINLKLYNYRARLYDPSIGRFISEDPKGFEAGINFYWSLGDVPVPDIDP